MLADKIRKSYGDRTALEALSFSCRRDGRHTRLPERSLESGMFVERFSTAAGRVPCRPVADGVS